MTRTSSTGDLGTPSPQNGHSKLEVAASSAEALPVARTADLIIDDDVPAGDPRLGRVIAGRYRIDTFIAKGGMGALYAATQLQPRRAVMLKLLSRNGREWPTFGQRFSLETAALGRLVHPNIA